MITQSQKLQCTQPSLKSFNQIFSLTVKIFFTLGSSGLRVRRCLNRMNYNEDDGDNDDDQSSNTEEGMFSSQCK